MSCAKLIGNTGESNCRALMAKAKGSFLVSMVNSTGVTPAIDPSISLTDTIIDGNINAVSKLDRWFPLMDLKAVKNERQKSEYFTYPDGSREFNRDGIRSIEMIRPSGTTNFLSKIESWESIDAGVFIVDEDGKLIGELNETTGFLEPIRIEANTFSANLIFGNDEQKSSTILIGFDFSTLVKDSSLAIIEPATGVNLLRKDGLLDINITTGVVTPANIPLTIDNGSGALNNLDKVEGLVAADFTITPIFGAPVLGVVTEPTPGNYNLAIVGGILGDTLTVTVAKTGLETITTPTITL